MDWKELIQKPASGHYDCVVGIDPDHVKSGVAFLNVNDKRFEYVAALSMPEMLKYFDKLKLIKDIGHLLVVIEDSSNSTNWHVNSLLGSGLPLRRKLQAAAAIGRSAGMCHSTLEHLAEIARSYGLEVLMQHPLKKFWAGKDGKITQYEMEYQNAGGIPKRTNQEERDAMLLCMAHGGIIPRVPPRK